MEKLLEAAAAAAEVVMKIYAESDPGVEMKGPNDPVTRADKEANILLLEHLTRDFPGVPLVAEESAPDAAKQLDAEVFLELAELSTDRLRGEK
jgi:3'(2'), 5'-bisphosphate nucleotidase